MTDYALKYGAVGDEFQITHPSQTHVAGCRPILMSNTEKVTFKDVVYIYTQTWHIAVTGVAQLQDLITHTGACLSLTVQTDFVVFHRLCFKPLKCETTCIAACSIEALELLLR